MALLVGMVVEALASNPCDDFQRRSVLWPVLKICPQYCSDRIAISWLTGVCLRLKGTCNHPHNC
jgi:hypothetical protein